MSKREVKEDKELLDLYQKLNDNNDLSWIDKLDAIIQFKKKNRGLVNISAPFIVPEEGKTLTEEDVAKGMFKMMKLCDEGKCEDVTDECL